MPEPRTHYQISLTARQAVGAFLALLVALGVAFFFGLMAGASGRSGSAPAASNATRPDAEMAEWVPPVETAVPTAVAPSGPLGSRTELGPGAFQTTPGPGEAPVPTTLHPFEDASAEEASPIASASEGRGPAPGRPVPAPAGGPGERFWVQVASLSSRDEAGALSTRLARRGFRSQVLTAAGPKGKGRVFRVRVGPYGSEDDANRAAAKLTKQENLKSPWVVPDGQ